VSDDWVSFALIIVLAFLFIPIAIGVVVLVIKSEDRY